MSWVRAVFFSDVWIITSGYVIYLSSDPYLIHFTAFRRTSRIWENCLVRELTRLCHETTVCGLTQLESSEILCHKPRYWSVTDWYKDTLLQGKQAQDASLWFSYRFRAGQTVGNSCGHSLVQVPECGNEFKQPWESCTTTGWSGDHITQEKWYDFQGN